MDDDLYQASPPALTLSSTRSTTAPPELEVALLPLQSPPSSQSHHNIYHKTSLTPVAQTLCFYGIPGCRGCRLDATISHAPHESQTIIDHQRAFYAAIFNLDGPSVIDSPLLDREGLFGCFTNELTWVTDFPQRHSLTALLREWFEHQHPLAIAATDSVLMTHFAHLTKNERAIDSARRQQSAAVAALRHAISRPHAAQDNAILAATDALGVCQMYGSGTSTRLAGNLTRLIYAAGPDHLRTRIRLQRDLVISAIHIIVTDAVLDRKVFLFSDPVWLRVLEEECNGHVWCILHLQCRLPELLKRTDELNGTGAVLATLSKINNLINDLGVLDRLFHDWYITWCTEIDGESVWTTSVSGAHRFVAAYGPVTEAFPTIFQFPSTAAALSHMYYWHMAYWVREAIYDLIVHHAVLLPDSYGLLGWARARVDECIDSLCRMVPFLLTKPGLINEGMLRVALKWYQRIGNTAKAAFCEAMLAKNGMSNFQFESQRERTAKSRDPGAGSLIFRRLLWNRAIGPSRCCRFRSPYAFHAAHDEG